MTTLGLLEDLKTEVVQSNGESISSIVKYEVIGVSSHMVMDGTDEIVGASLTGITVKVKLSESAREPSLILKFKVTTPVLFALGVRMNLQ